MSIQNLFFYWKMLERSMVPQVAFSRAKQKILKVSKNVNCLKVYVYLLILKSLTSRLSVSFFFPTEKYHSGTCNIAIKFIFNVFFTSMARIFLFILTKQTWPHSQAAFLEENLSLCLLLLPINLPTLGYFHSKLSRRKLLIAVYTFNIKRAFEKFKFTLSTHTVCKY